MNLLDLSQKCSLWKKFDGKECDTAKGEAWQLSLINLKIFYLVKKIWDTNENNSKWKHKLGTYEINKISCFDDKRYVLDDEIHTLAYFHKASVTSSKEI